MEETLNDQRTISNESPSEAASKVMSTYRAEVPIEKAEPTREKSMAEKELEIIKSQKEALRYKRDRDRVLVKGIFNYHQIPGGKLEFFLKLYEQDPVEKYSLVDGTVYELPRGVARHLNRSGINYVHKHTLDENGMPATIIGTKLKRYSFSSLEFTDLDEMNEEERKILTVPHNAKKVITHPQIIGA